MILEVRLRDFMTFEGDILVPFRPGLNIIAGPNGAGKTSIVSAIQLCLGSLARERKSRISDFIRRGKREAVISTVIDNRPRGGRRVIPLIDSDRVEFTRVIMQKGRGSEYYVNGVYRQYREVKAILDESMISVDNPLVVMPQGKVNAWIDSKPRERLLYFEELLGLDKLHAAIAAMDRGIEELDNKLSELDAKLRELEADVEIRRKEAELLERKEEAQRRLVELERMRIAAEALELKKRIEDTLSQLHALESEASKARTKVEEKIALERGALSRIEQLVMEEAAVRERLTKAREMREEAREEINAAMKEILDAVSRLDASSAKLALSKLQRAVRGFEKAVDEVLSGELRLREIQVEREINERSIHQAKTSAQRWARRVDELEQQISSLEADVAELKRLLDERRKVVTEEEISRAPPVNDVEAELERVRGELEALKPVDPLAKEKLREATSVLEKLRNERRKIAEERDAIMERRQEAVSRWRSTLEQAVNDVNGYFQELISKVGGEGYVALEGANPYEMGLEIYVGFDGAPPEAVSSMAHSGGERTLSTVGLLLAVQEMKPSPFRILDEFEIHLDPENFERVSLLLKEASRDTQYIVITPARLRIPPHADRVVFISKYEGAVNVQLRDKD